MAVFLALFGVGAAQAVTPVNPPPPTAHQAVPVIQLQKHTLVVGSEQDYPPFVTGMSDATAGGFTVDLWKAVAAEAGLNYTLHVAPFHQILQEFRDGKVDVLINLAQSDERHRFADFSVPHAIVHGAVFVRKGGANIRSEADLAGKSLIVLKADLAYDYAVSKGWGKQLVLVDTAAEGLRLLASGRHDAMLLSKLVGLQTLQAQGLGELEALKVKVGFSQKFAFAVQEGQSELLGQLNEGLALTKSNGTYDALYEKWFGIYEDKEDGRGDLLKYLAAVVAAFLFYGGYFFYRHEIERRQAYRVLRESEERFRNLTLLSSDWYWEQDAQFRFVRMDGDLELNTGIPAAKLMGLTRWDIPALNLSASDWDAHRALLNAHSPFHDFEIQRPMQAGREYWISISGTPILDAAGRFMGYRGVGKDITSRRQAQEALRQNEKTLRLSQTKLKNILEGAADAIFIMDQQGRYQYVNLEASRLLGYGCDHLLDMSLRDVTPSEDLPEFLFLFAKLLATGSLRCELRLQRQDGHLVPVDFNGTLLADGSVFGSCRDISERRLAEEKLHLAASVFTHSREGIMITTANGSIIDVNDAFTRITGYDRDEVVGKNPRILRSGRQTKEYYAAMWRDLGEKGHWYSEVWNRRKSGEVYAEMQTISAVRDVHGKTQQYVALFSDITALKAHQKQLEHIAHFDALTSLPNRVLLADRLHQGIAQVKRRGQRLAVAFLDLDGFKAVNDRHGHEAGDQLLIALSARMKLALREGDTLARLGGDEFVAVLDDLDDIQASLPMLNRLLVAAAEPVQFGDRILQVSASVGVTFYPQAEEVDADQLLRQADQAMYQAKLAGKNRYHVFDAEQDRSVRGHHESLERIRLALSEREFVLYYQPKVNMRTGRVIGAEALIRWQHPEKGLLLPAVFLPVIEDHPLAVDIGEWAIDTALSQMALWRALGLDIPVSVNVGARQLQQTDFARRLGKILAAHPGVRPGALELEVLETSALEDVAGVSQIIEACRELGVLFALDDFGTGYSSLTYLKRLAVTQLKIDQSFVRDMLDDPDDLAILEGVIGLASAFHRQVIAEGVETVEHGAMLLQLGCDLAQGYGIARPMPAHELPDWQAGWLPDPAWDDQPAVSRDDLPLLFASVEHRAWIKAMESHLKGERETPPPLDPQQCRFGQWLDGEGQTRYGAIPFFATIDTLHLQVHGLASELCEMRAQGRQAQALARLGELHGLRDALLVQLKGLVATFSRAP